MGVFSIDGIGPSLPPDGTYWIAPSAVVIGRVIVSRGVGIWFNAVIRGDNEPIEIGQDTNIQEHCMLHTDAGFPLTVGAGCTVGHRAIVHGCTIGSNVLIGMGAMILNGAVIGDDCLIGAGALVPEGRDVPAGSLILGFPAKVMRQLNIDEIGRNKVSAAHYVANWKRFAAGLQSLRPSS